MRTEILRMNFNHCIDLFKVDYLGYKNALSQCVVVCLSHINKLSTPIPAVVFEDTVLGQAWYTAQRQPHSESAILSLGLDGYRQYIPDMMEDLESFILRKYPAKRGNVYVQVSLDNSCHLCVQLRYF